MTQDRQERYKIYTGNSLYILRLLNMKSKNQLSEKTSHLKPIFTKRLIVKQENIQYKILSIDSL